VAACISLDLSLTDLDGHEQRIAGTVAADFPDDVYTSALWKPPSWTVVTYTNRH
jgi:hypothetical protein